MRSAMAGLQGLCGILAGILASHRYWTTGRFLTHTPFHRKYFVRSHTARTKPGPESLDGTEGGDWCATCKRCGRVATQCLPGSASDLGPAAPRTSDWTNRRQAVLRAG